MRQLDPHRPMDVFLCLFVGCLFLVLSIGAIEWMENLALCKSAGGTYIEGACVPLVKNWRQKGLGLIPVDDNHLDQ